MFLLIRWANSEKILPNVEHASIFFFFMILNAKSEEGTQ